MKTKLFWLAPLATLALAACGGGGGGSSTTPVTTAKATTANGTMTKTAATSITVNGTSFDVSAASVRIDDRAGSAAELRSGMRVRIRASDDGAGHVQAREVEAENEVRGAITTVSAATAPQFFNIGAVKVIVDGSTIYDNLSPAGFAALQAGVFVEVNGMRDATGAVLATRVEGKGARNGGAAEVDELHGVIGTLGAGQFTLGSVTVTYTAGTTFTPAASCSASSLAQGQRVEAHGAFTSPGTFAATRIDCEDKEDASRLPGAGERAGVEGLIGTLDVANKTLTVNGTTVTWSSSTEFKRGTEADLALNVKIEVHGTFDGTRLVATEIEFERVRIIFTGVPSAVATGGVTIFGKAVQVNDATEVRSQTAGGGNSSSLADIVAGTDRIEVRAVLDNGTLIAERVTEVGSSGGGGKDIIQAPVVTKNEASLTLGLLDAGSPIAVALTGAQFQARDGSVISASAFFAQVTAASSTSAGTLVKAKGRFAGGTLTAEEVELED